MGAEQRGRVIRGLAVVGQPRRRAAGEELGMGASESPGKPFDISKRDVWEAWLKVKENQGPPGVDQGRGKVVKYVSALRRWGGPGPCGDLRVSKPLITSEKARARDSIFPDRS